MTEQSLSSQKNERRAERSGGLQERLFERREKGLWSFLTWSFFLSQMVGAEQASAGAARSAGTADEAGSTNDANAGPAAGHAFLPPGLVALAEMQEAAAAQPAQSLAQVAAPPAFLPDAPAEFTGPAGGDSPDEASAMHNTSAALASPAEISPGANAAPAVVSLSPEFGGDVPGLGDALLQALGIPPVVEEVIAPVVELVGDVVGEVAAPVVGILGDVVGDVVQVLDPVVEQVVAPVIGIVGDLVEQVVAPAVSIVGDVVEQVVAPVIEPVLEQVVAPVVGIARRRRRAGGRAGDRHRRRRGR